MGVCPIPCRRQNPVNAEYDSTAPLAVSSSWTRTRFPLQEANRSRICWRCGSAFSARRISGTLAEFSRRTLRTVRRDTFSTRAISRRLTPLVFSSRIAVLCASLSMFGCLLLSHSFRHPRQFPPRAFDPALRLLLLRAVHLPHRLGEPPVGAMQDGRRQLQIARHLLEGGRLGCRRLPLCFQKQLWLGQYALAGHRRSLAPGRIQLPGLPRVATVFDECGRHSLAMLRTHTGHRHQILHSHWRRDLALAHLLLDRFRQ